MTEKTGIHHRTLAIIHQQIASSSELELRGLVALSGMTGHYVSTSAENGNGVTYLFPIEVDGVTYHIYLQQG